MRAFGKKFILIKLVNVIIITNKALCLKLELMLRIDMNKSNIKMFSNIAEGTAIIFISSSFGVLTANHKLFKISISF